MKRRCLFAGLAVVAALVVCQGCENSTNPCPTLTGPGMECWKGIGECRRLGHYVCDPERGYAVCGAVPGEPTIEVCDGLDNDCDENYDEDFDADHDTYSTCGTRTTTGEAVAADCDDLDPLINPGRMETCNGKDDDCDGETDEDQGDTSCGFGVCFHTVENCINGLKQVCDPQEGASPEICDGLDNDCDGKIDEDFDADHDTFTTCGTLTTTGETVAVDCDDLDPLINPGRMETCNGKDDDCDGLFDEDFDADRDTFTTCGTLTTTGETVAADCDDFDPLINPGRVEICDGLDNDCDGKIDEDFDADHDTFTTCGTLTTTGESVTADCDDGNAEINPGMKDVCNLVDDDCDGETDEQPDADDSCSDDFYCNGQEVCEAGACKHADAVPCPWWPCDEENQVCEICTSDANCDEGDECQEPHCDSAGRCDNITILGKICDDGVECTVGICGIYDGHPGCSGVQYEGSQYDDICRDGIDNDCDGLTDSEEPDCCVPDCTGVECGDGGCRDQQFACGTCPAVGESCVAGHCRPTGLEWIDIPGGTFMMGSPDGVGDDDEHPQHQVTVPDFEMLKTEVTVAQYLDCVESDACSEPLRAGDCGTWCNRCNWTVAGRDNNPVVCVNWYQAVDYCQFIGGRLPSEAEWEYAARSGGQDITYPWGDEDPTCDLAVLSGVAPGPGCGLWHEWPVCSKPAGNTAQGLCDMAGNVWEFAQDWYHENYSNAPDNGSAWEDPPTNGRVIRGGAWDDNAYNSRASAREGANPGIGADPDGFRCARVVE